MRHLPRLRASFPRGSSRPHGSGDCGIPFLRRSAGGEFPRSVPSGPPTYPAAAASSPNQRRASRHPRPHRLRRTACGAAPESVTAQPILETLAKEFSTDVPSVQAVFEMLDAGPSALIGRFRRSHRRHVRDPRSSRPAPRRARGARSPPRHDRARTGAHRGSAGEGPRRRAVLHGPLRARGPLRSVSPARAGGPAGPRPRPRRTRRPDRGGGAAREASEVRRARGRRARRGRCE